MEVVEGEARIDTGGIFYNPKMKFCRDMDVLLAKALSLRVTFLDSLAATGIRGIRMALEAGLEVTLNDRGKNAYKVILRNCEINGLKCNVINMDANIVYHLHRFEWVDVDPFGSPVEFLDGAVRYAKMLISVTATDTAPLCGTYPKACLRKYDAISFKTDFYPELGLRILIGKLARTSASREKGIKVLLSWGKEHYFRVHAKVERGARRADETMEKVGFVFYCRNCGWRTAISIADDFPECCECGKKMKRIGPLWLGELEDKEIVDKILKIAKNSGMKEHESLLTKISRELNTPFYYDLHFIGKLLRKNIPPTHKVVTALIDMGYSASETRFSGTSVKTDAPFESLKSVFG